MATSTYLLSTALMGVFVLAVGFLVARGRAWESYTPRLFGRDSGERLSENPTALTAGFVLLLVVGIGLTLLAAGGNTVVFLAGAGALVVGFLVLGVYVTAKSNGHPHSHAVGEAIVTLGAVVLVGLVGWLLTTAGA